MPQRLLRKGPSGFPQERRDHDRRRVSCCRGTLPAFPESTLLPPPPSVCVCVRACACVRTRGYASLVTQASKSGGRPLRPLADLSSNDERPSAGYGIHRDPGGPMVQAASAQAPAQWCMRRGPRRVTHGACCMKPCRTNSVWCMPYCMGCILHAAWLMVCGAASHGAGGLQIARFNLHGVRLMNRQGPSNRPSTRADIVRTVESLPPGADSV